MRLLTLTVLSLFLISGCSPKKSQELTEIDPQKIEFALLRHYKQHPSGQTFRHPDGSRQIELKIASPERLEQLKSFLQNAPFTPSPKGKTLLTKGNWGSIDLTMSDGAKAMLTAVNGCSLITLYNFRRVVGYYKVEEPNVCFELISMTEKT